MFDEVFLPNEFIFNYFCALVQILPLVPFLIRKSIQQNIVNKSLEFRIIIIPLHPF
jgi:hypothetical protein